MTLVHGPDGLCAALFAGPDPTEGACASPAGFGADGACASPRGFGPLPQAPVPAFAAHAFGAYFAGETDALSALPTGARGSGFEVRVWAELSRIPPGETRSYADIARALGGAASGSGPNARAVGTANARNPLAVIVPCHRVIGSHGRLTGYAGGLNRKAWLLKHEGWRATQPALI